MGLALDEPTDEDKIQKEADFDLMISKELLEKFGGVKIDYRSARWGGGFYISPTNEHSGGCGCDC